MKQHTFTRQGRPPRIAFVVCAFAIVRSTCGAPADPGAASGPTAMLADLNLSELVDVRVTSVSRKPEAAVDTSAAVSVITQDDIRRSGAQSIPDVLRREAWSRPAEERSSVPSRRADMAGRWGATATLRHGSRPSRGMSSTLTTTMTRCARMTGRA